MTARNFNPIVASCGRVTVAEVEHLQDEPLDPDAIVTPGIYVNRIVPWLGRPKEIEQRTVRPTSMGVSSL